MTRVRIDTPPVPAGSYDVLIEAGAFERLATLIAEIVSARHFAVISDAVVADLLGERVRKDLEDAGFTAELVRFPAGEQQKNRDSWGSVIDAVAGRGLGRDGCVVAVGGGVTGDLAGFVAASFMRGVPVIQVPTTLLSMVDASVGGKTGLDTPLGKNMIGAFHQPAAVIVDPRTLASLPADHFRAGLAEAVKHGAITDEPYLDWIVANAGPVGEHDEGALEELIRRSVEIKAAIVSADPTEQGPRQALNFGHTFAHALETWTGYRTLHGFAVGVGMVAAAEVGERAGITAPGTTDRLREALEPLHVPVRPTGVVPAERILDLARLDKKSREGRIRYTLLARLGQVARGSGGGWSVPLEDDLVAGVLRDLWG
ncbi:MAG: 3-dehydroquinate synthase [Gemmatimonadota bacterium]